LKIAPAGLPTKNNNQKKELATNINPPMSSLFQAIASKRTKNKLGILWAKMFVAASANEEPSLKISNEKEARKKT